MIAELDEDIVHKRRGFESYRRCDVASLDKTRSTGPAQENVGMTYVDQGEYDGLCI